MPTSPTPDDLLALVRFCWPEHEWHTPFMWPFTKPFRRVAALHSASFLPHSRDHVTAAEAVLIARGLGVEYRDAMVNLYHREVMNTDWKYDYNVWALVAPLDARVRAMVQVVREEEAKRGS